VSPGAEFTVEATIHYPGPGPFAGQHPAANARATLTLPDGFTLATGSSHVPLPTLYAGDTATAAWSVIAGSTNGLHALELRASGMVTSDSWSYSSYTDSIGGRAELSLRVGEGEDPWMAASRLTDSPAASSTALPNGRAMVVEPGGTIHLVYSDAAPGNGEIYYRRASGGSWESPVRLTDSIEWSYNPVLALGPDGDLHVAWMEVISGIQTLQYMRGDGEIWSAATQLGIPGQRYHNPSIAALADGTVFVTWWRQGSSSSSVYYQRYDGSVWETVGYVDGNSSHPAIAADENGEVLVIYERERSWTGVSDIQCKVWNGSDWDARIKVSDDSSYAHSPALAIAPDGTPHAVWSDGRDGTGNIYHSSFDGFAWAAEDGVEMPPSDAQYPSLAIGAEGVLHVTWQDFREGWGEIYYCRHDGVWSEGECVSRAREHPSALGCVGADAIGQVSVVWTDERDGNAEIYYRLRASAGAGLDLATERRPEELRFFERIGPVPARDRATLSFRVDAAGPVVLELFDLSGRCLQRDGFRALRGGRHERAWELRDAAGRPFPAGVYFCRLATGGGVETRPLVIVGP